MGELINLEILTKTFEDLPTGIGIFEVEDLDDLESIRYVFMNKILLYEMRKEKEEVIGKKIIEVAPEAYQHEGGLLVIDTYRRIAAEGGSINLGLVEYSNHMVAGTYECSVHHIQDNYVYVMLRNVTELEKTKNELERKNKEVSQMAYIVSHDLKEPLRTVSSFTDLIRQNYQGKFDEQGDKMLSIITESSDRMTNLIDDLMNYSSLGRFKEMVIVDTKELVEYVQQDLESIIKDTGTSLIVDDLPKVRGYKTELRLLFQNLIGNAIKFGKSDLAPVIRISAKKEESWVFTIKDNGIGIANEYLKKIFSIFQRLHARNEYEGTGIGLAHCKKIVELHQGEIWVESELDKGSAFHFTIPDMQ